MELETVGARARPCVAAAAQRQIRGWSGSIPTMSATGLEIWHAPLGRARPARTGAARPAGHELTRESTRPPELGGLVG